MGGAPGEIAVLGASAPQGFLLIFSRKPVDEPLRQVAREILNVLRQALVSCGIGCCSESARYVQRVDGLLGHVAPISESSDVRSGGTGSEFPVRHRCPQPVRPPILAGGSNRTGVQVGALM
ncbi:hypothetical protein A6A06_23665 [Streptomyces sp. CB02923]|nr:hypothetical protein A6A06_23665 [Streptomyces sp. CB02923]